MLTGTPPFPLEIFSKKKNKKMLKKRITNNLSKIVDNNY